jgi:hypothetical protein
MIYHMKITNNQKWKNASYKHDILHQIDELIMYEKNSFHMKQLNIKQGLLLIVFCLNF